LTPCQPCQDGEEEIIDPPLIHTADSKGEVAARYPWLVDELGDQKLSFILIGDYKNG
jgi:hypothetical protein